MASEQKTSDAVRITRIVAPIVFILALALIFKDEFGDSMNRGCFEISIEHAGIDMKDQSLCSPNDINQMAGEMTQLGATKAEERADSAFAEFEALLLEMGQENEMLQEELGGMQKVMNEQEQKAFELAREMESQIRRIANRDARRGAQEIYNQYVARFLTYLKFGFKNLYPAYSLQNHNKAYKKISSDIRARYITKTQVDVQQVQQQIKVKQKKENK
jgi:hypothetical protein